MDGKPEKKRIKEIEDVYRNLGITSERVRKYLLAPGGIPYYEEQEKEIIFIEAGANSE